MRRLAAVLLLSTLASAAAAPVRLDGAPLAPGLETRADLDTGVNPELYTLLDERLPLSALAQFGVAVAEGPDGFRLARAGRRLEYVLGVGWLAAAGPEETRPVPTLGPPVPDGGQAWVPVRALAMLGFEVRVEGGAVNVVSLPGTAPSSSAAPPSPPEPAPTVPPAPTAPAPAAPIPPSAPPAAVPAPAPPAPSLPATPVPAPTPPPTPAPTPAPTPPAPLPPVAPSSPPTAAIRPAPVVPPAVPNEIRALRLSKGRSSRFVLDLARPVEYGVAKETGRVRVTLRGTTARPRFQSVGSESVSRLRVAPLGPDTLLEIETAARASVSVFALSEPDRLVVDAAVPEGPPPLPGPLPVGTTYGVVTTPTGKLHLLGFEPARYAPRVVAAPWGGTRSVLEYAQLAGAPVAVNGGYFDPASNQPVDLALASGNLLAYARGNRATVGFPGGPPLFGVPRVRLSLSLPGLEPAGPPRVVNVSAIRPGPHPAWVTAFVGDGFVPTGGPGHVTLVLAGGVVVERRAESFTPAPGAVTVSFAVSAWPDLDRPVGSPAGFSLAWTEPAWAGARDVLAAGPMLVRGGRYALDPALEGFDVTASIWRPTRQAAFGVDGLGRYVIALLEHGSPEDLARALVSAGLREAMRLDSGTSAAVSVSGGMLAGVWGRPVPNALVMAPRF